MLIITPERRVISRTPLKAFFERLYDCAVAIFAMFGFFVFLLFFIGWLVNS